MKDKVSHMDYGCRNANQANDSTSQVKALTEEIQRLKMLFAKLTETMSWGNSVVKVVFRDEYFEDKYRLKFETFLKEILDEDEHFILNCQIYDNTEKEYIKLQHSLEVEKASKSFDCERKKPNSVPIYSSEFEDVLHCDEPEIEDQGFNDKPQTMTCFNCLKDHHMKQCPEKMDRMRIAANKKDILMGNSSRYHEEERKNSIKPGNLSSELREALGLKSDQLPQYIYKMRVIGYPPGWMNDAVFETSGLSLYDTDGKAISEDESSGISKNEIKYDSCKFVEYPGFNCAVPTGFKDEWQSLSLVPMQSHHLLCESLNASNTVNSSNMYKRKNTTSTCEEDTKKIRNGMNDASESFSQWSPDNSSTPKKQESPSINSHIEVIPVENSLSISISKSPGTPILAQGNCYKKLPGANKFAEGITEHLPFENLPDAVGKFEKIRGVLCEVQKKLQNLKKSS